MLYSNTSIAICPTQRNSTRKKQVECENDEYNEAFTCNGPRRDTGTPYVIYFALFSRNDNRLFAETPLVAKLCIYWELSATLSSATGCCHSRSIMFSSHFRTLVNSASYLG